MGMFEIMGDGSAPNLMIVRVCFGKKLGQHRNYLASTALPQSVIEGSQGRNSKQEPGGWN